MFLLWQRVKDKSFDEISDALCFTLSLLFFLSLFMYLLYFSYSFVCIYLLIHQGKYLFLEASEKKAVEGAILASSTIGPGKSVCVQFWYHMKGVDIGSLKVYIQKNETKTLVWNTTSEQGDKWNFGQVGYTGDSKSYKVWVIL